MAVLALPYVPPPVTGPASFSLRLCIDGSARTVFLSLLHTFPFVVQGTREIRPNTDGRNPNHLSQLEWSWHVKHSVVSTIFLPPRVPSHSHLMATLPLQYYWSGIAALVPLAWLCFASLAPIRRAAYECFKWLHLVSAILFSAFFYIHCNAVSLHTDCCTRGEALPDILSVFPQLLTSW